MISALQHYSYCPRQCGLIHLDQAWDENLYTLRGRRVHEQVDVPGGETAYGVRIERALPLWSDRLGTDRQGGRGRVPRRRAVAGRIQARPATPEPAR